MCVLGGCAGIQGDHGESERAVRGHRLHADHPELRAAVPGSTDRSGSPAVPRPHQPHHLKRYVKHPGTCLIVYLHCRRWTNSHSNSKLDGYNVLYRNCSHWKDSGLDSYPDPRLLLYPFLARVVVTRLKSEFMSSN